MAHQSQFHPVYFVASPQLFDRLTKKPYLPQKFSKILACDEVYIVRITSSLDKLVPVSPLETQVQLICLIIELKKLWERAMTIKQPVVYLASAVLCATLIACGSQQRKTDSAADIGQEKLSDLQIVDCLLPGQVRRLGTSSYMTPRRPAELTAAECRIKGGEYVEFDRADYKTALNVWMPAANAGDPEAQANVGQIFERGLGGEPNYEAAVIWYQKAADQGNARAQFNLGTMYEQGLGVEQNKLIALNWYRKAWGMPEDNVIFASAAAREQETLRQQLEKELKQKTSQIGLLARQLNDLKTKSTTQDTHAQQEIKQLNDWIAKLNEEKQLAVAGLDKLPRYRNPSAPAVTQIKSVTNKENLVFDNISFGKYFALIIGNQNYDAIEDLATPHGDSLKLKEILENMYGYDVTVLLDADNANIMRAINGLNSKIGPDDNLLIFYAGHGNRIKTGDYEAGYWLPVNASAPPDDTFWVSNEFVTRHLARIQAKRVMVVADSCYAGLLSNAPGYLFMGDKVDYSMEYIQYKLPKKSRLLLSSGGDSPVLDNFGQGNSVFARAFISVLENSQGVITGPELFLKVRDLVRENSKASGLDQIPEFKAIKGAGHEVGDFFFVKRPS